MTIRFDSVYVTATGSFLPGAPVDNENIDRFIAPLSGASGRIKRRILAENGIASRHYAIDEDGVSRYSVAQLAAGAVRACLESSEVGLADVSVLCTGTSGGDIGAPGFANMVQGELHAGPMHTSSHQGICAAGVAALQHAASAVELGEHRHALVVASEMPSRMFKRSRFAPRGYDTDFDSHFLRWMLSDGAGACLLSSVRGARGPALKLKWIHTRSFSGDLPVCMQIGYPEDSRERSYLDYPSLAEAEADGAFLLRQDIRLLPHLFELGIHEYAQLVRGGFIDPAKVDHFLCHYSSRKFAPVVEDLMQKVGLSIPTERWYSNLTTRGNTGAASIFIMLADFVRERALEPGQQVLCFVPESGRFTVGFMLLEVCGEAGEPTAEVVVQPPHDPANASPRLRRLISNLAGVWHDYRSRAWRTNLIRRITTQQLGVADYARWMSCWIPQVREGTRWMRQAVANLGAPYEPLQSLIRAHAQDEQFDYEILFQDYRAAGGTVERLDDLQRNPGGEALNAYMHSLAKQHNPIGLLGAIYIIEGTGQRIIPALLPMLRKQLDLPERAFRFLAYHGENDSHHLTRWLTAVEMALDLSGDAVEESIVSTASATAELYLLQLGHAV